FSSRRRHTRSKRDWSSDVCSSDLQNINDEQISGLYSLCDELETYTTDDLVQASRNDAVFHRNIAVASCNSFFVILLDALGRSLLDTRVATFSMDPERLSTVAAAHRSIADGIASRDPSAAAAAMRAHLTEVVDTWNRWAPKAD